MKYPRTWHLPGSPGGTRDDSRMTSFESFVGRSVVLTEKMDGSNVCLQRDACFARSHGHAPAHPSFSGLKALHATVKSRLPPDLQLFGEWLFARHSIHYRSLPGYLQLFAVRDLRRGRWLAWDQVRVWAEVIEAPTVPVLAVFDVSTEEDLRVVLENRARLLARDTEGFVVRWEGAFDDTQFSEAVAKWVRAEHVTSSEHWQHQPLVRNLLQGDGHIGQA